MKIFCGIDISVKLSAFCFVDEKGNVLKGASCRTEEEALGREIQAFKDVHVVVEASPLAETICEWIEGYGATVHVLDPRQAKAVTQSKKKTDRLDARKLAQLARTGFYTVVHRKSGTARELRTLLQARIQIVKSYRAMGSAILGLLRSHGIVVKTSGGQEKFVKTVVEACQRLSSVAREGIMALVMQWQSLSREEKRLYRLIGKLALKDAIATRLMTVPGVGPATAIAFKVTIDDPRRFPTKKQVSSYIGLTPRVYQSGDTEFRGRITKQGDPMLRTLLNEAANVLLTRIKTDDPIKEWGLRLQEKKGYAKARTAVARKLACLLHHLWVHEENYCCSSKAA